MRKVYCLLSLVLFLLGFDAYGQNRYWIANTPGNWNDIANWSTSSGGSAGASVPGSGNVAIFNNSANGNCTLDIAPTVGGITISGFTGIIDLSGFDLTTTGTNTFTSGTISNTGAAASVALNSAGTSTFNGTTFNANVTGSSGRIYFSGSVFNGSVALAKSGTNTDSGTGGNTFNSTVTLTNSNTGSLQLAGTNPDIFQSTLTLNVDNTGDISLARVAAANQFNDNITINYNSTGNVLFGAGNGTSTLASTKTITVAGYGASGCGNLSMAYFTQSGAASQTITLAGNNNATLTIGPSSIFNGSLTVSTPNIILQTSTFVGTTLITKTGSTTSSLRGGNIFNGTTTITNQGGDLAFGSVSTDPGDTFNGDITFNNLGGNRIRVPEQSSGTVFNGTVIFNSSAATDVNNRVQVSRLTGAQSTFNGPVYFNNNGNASDIHISYDPGTSTTFNGPVYFTSSATNGAEYFIGNDGNVTFTNNVEFNSTCSDIIYAANGAGTVTFGNGSMSVGSGGFSIGQLRLQNFTQTGTLAQSLTFTGTASLYLGPSSTFNGDVTAISPQIYLNGCTFNSTTYLEKNGATTNTGNGSNTFNGITTLVNSGSGSFVSGNTTIDTFNDNLTLTNTGSSSINMAENTAGNIFNGNITVNSTGGNGIYFCNNSGATASLANGKTIAVGATGFSAGELRLQRFTQTGATAQSLTFTGTASLKMGPSTQFNGNVNFVAPQIYLNGTTFNGTTSLEKNGATDNTGAGGDTFNGVTTITNSGSGSLELANTSADVFNNTLTINNSGTHRIQIGLSSAGNTFNGSVTVNYNGATPANTNLIIARNPGSTATFNGTLTLNCNNTGSTSTGIIIGYDGAVSINGNITVSSTNGRGVLFGNNTGSVVLGSGYTVTSAAGTFTTGTLQFKSFTQTGNTTQNITLSGTAILSIGQSSTFNGNVNFVTPQIYLNGCTFNGTAYIEKNGASTNSGTGSNVFNGVTTLVNSGSGSFISGNTSVDTFNADLTLTNTGSSYIGMADNSSGNVFNGNIVVNSTSGAGVYFGDGGSGAASTLASGKTITVGASGFSVGQLRIKRFTQLGSTAQTLTLTGTAVIRTGPSSQFNGAVTFTAPRILLDGTTFNSTASIQKNGASTDANAGGNVFNGTTTLTSGGSGIFRLSVTNADTFTGDVTFVRSSTGVFDIAYAQTNTFAGNIILNSSSGVSFGSNGGTVQFTGSSNQSISKTGGSASPTIPILSMSKSSGALTLNTDLTVSSSAAFTNGIINTTSTNYLNFADNATASGINDASYVDGPVRKTGNDIFTFPVGNGSYYRPISISAPGNTTDHFTAQYYKSAQTSGGPSTWDPSFVRLSGCEYWVLDRTNGTSNVTVTLSWNESACGTGYITSLPDLRVARFNSATSTWTNEGNGATTGTSTSGTISSAAAITTFCPFTLASVDDVNPLPVELGPFWAINLGNAVELNWITYSEENNSSFSIQRSQTGFNFTNIGKRKGAGNSKNKINYTYIDGEPLSGTSYYRLKQKDFDGKETYSKVIAIKRQGETIPFVVYPNPAGNEIVRFNQKTNIVILNSLNQIIMTMQEAESIDASNLPSGLYIIINQIGEVARLIKK
jgi:hypothetical protein